LTTIFALTQQLGLI